MGLVLKIRGIYATALTQFFLDKGFRVALPSGPMAGRFAGCDGFDAFEAPDVQVMDLDSKQGILMEGEEEFLNDLLSQVRDGLFDAVTRRRAKNVLEIEFPSRSKSCLDEIRNTVISTLPLHHRLKIIASDQVDVVEEKTLSHHPEMRESVARDVERKLVWDRYERGKEIAIEHVKLEGKVLNLSEGEVVEADFAKKRLVLKRFKFKGRSKYDGLGIPKQEGDYAVSEIQEGDWYYRHTYHRAEGEKIGAYYNINTPVEFYPDRIRYVDLEIDVVQFADGRVKVVDEGELSKRFEEGYLSATMREKALSEASRLRDKIL
jgi:hypothetical protein